MANITLTTTESNIVVDATNNIIQVNSTPTTVVVAEGGGLDLAAVRQAISNVSPILYNNTTGVISFDANATFSGKTTDDLPQGNSNIYFSTSGAAVTTTNLPEGTNLYFTAARARGNVSATSATGITYDSGTGVFSLAGIPNSSLTNTTVTINGKSVALGSSNTLTTSDIGEGTNLYFTAARARGNVSATDAGGMGAFSYSSGTGVFTYTGPSDSEVRAVISAANTTTGHGNISYSSSTGVITYDRVTPANILSEITAGNVKLKQYSETVFNAGNQSGNVTLNLNNGSIQKLDLVGNITGLAFTNITAGSTVSLILRQDAIGFRRLNTTSFASNWTTWDFVGDHTTLTVDPLAYDILTVTYDGTNNFASLVNFDQPVIQNSQLANSNVIVNGVTIALGSSGNIDTFNSNVTVNGNLNVTGNLNYQNVTDLYVTDQKITLNANATTNSNVEIISNRPTATSVMLKWNEPSTRWEFTNDGTTYYAIATSTTDLAEGSNLWFTTARANSAIDNRLVGSTGISYTAGTVALDFSEFNTGNITEGTNLYFTTDRANTAIGAYQGNISTAGNITAGNVITTNIHTNGTSLVLNSNSNVVLKETINGVSTNVGNISGDGYGLVVRGNFNVANATPIVYSGNSSILTYTAITGNTTLGSNVITGITSLENNRDTADSISNIILNSLVFSDSFVNTYPFPVGTYVTQLDAANSQVFVSQNAIANLTFDAANVTYIVFRPGAYDSSTGQSIAFRTSGDLTLGGNASNIIQTAATTDTRYGYPASGFTPSDFDFYSVGTASDYSLTRDISSLFQGRTQFEAPRTVMNLQRGLVVGNGDMTNRGENDALCNFGVNVMWDGLTSNVDFGGNNPATQVLIKNYTDNSAQTGTNRVNSGPRIFFTAAEGNKNQPYQITYPRNNLELGRISWFSGAQTTAPGGLSTLAPPAFISVVTNRDMTGSHTGGVGMYLSASPNNNIGRRGLFIAHQLGDTLISSSNTTSSGASLPITFAPMWTATTAATAGNAVSQFNNTMGATNYQWANVNYDNATSKTGSKLTVTNGISTVAGRNGNLTLSLDRNDNGAGFGSKEWAFKLRSGQTDLVLTEDDVVRTTFAGANITTAGNITASTFLGNLNGTTATLSSTANITGNVNLGTNATINYDAVYGCFHNMANVTAAAADTVYAFTWPNVHINTNRVTVASNTQITIGQEGAYNFALEMQAENTDNQDRTAFIWLAKNGTDIEESCVRVSLLKQWKQVIVKEWIVNGLNANDYIEVRFAVDNPSGIQLTSIPAQASPYARPAVPSAVITVRPVGA